MENTQVQVPHINKNAKINIDFGTQLIVNLQIALTALTVGKTKEEIEGLKIKMESKQELADWETGCATLVTLINAIYKEAERTGQITYKSLDQSLGI